MTQIKKAQWIAEQTKENLDDIYDILEGNITRPWPLVQQVETMSREYDEIYSRAMQR